jgi:hypothetical protein
MGGNTQSKVKPQVGSREYKLQQGNWYYRMIGMRGQERRQNELRQLQQDLAVSSLNNLQNIRHQQPIHRQGASFSVNK